MNPPLPGSVKRVGRRKPPQTPQECYALAAKLHRAALAMSPFPLPRGFVKKARTWEELHQWRREQSNPWLW